MKKVRITQIKGIVRVLPEHKVNLAALGLHGVDSTNELTLTPAIQGIINRVRHMVKVEEI
ncbi:MAG: 50S ribosomal protein L30 [Fibrobacteraceae bacterium]|nr:50S ribosomal protein L30 [Fibrobacteraceae bacterium]